MGVFLRMQQSQSEPWHGTTILTVRKGGVVAIGGDGQVSIGQTIIKSNAKKVRRLGKGDVIGGFAGATADAFTLFERLEAKLEQYPGQLMRAAVELAKDWRTDRYLRRLEAMMIVALAEAADLLGVRFDDGLADRDLAVAADGDHTALADGEDGRAVPELGLGLLHTRKNPHAAPDVWAGSSYCKRVPAAGGEPVADPGNPC